MHKFIVERNLADMLFRHLDGSDRYLVAKDQQSHATLRCKAKFEIPEKQTPVLIDSLLPQNGTNDCSSQT